VEIHPDKKSRCLAPASISLSAKQSPQPQRLIRAQISLTTQKKKKNKKYKNNQKSTCLSLWRSPFLSLNERIITTIFRTPSTLAENSCAEMQFHILPLLV